MSRVVVLGAGGQVGREVLRAPRPEALQLVGYSRQQVDILDAAAVVRAVDGAATVINLAAYTAVDRAEAEVEAAFAVNRDAVAELARCCARSGASLIHVSTDFVFDGTKQTAYQETDPVEPLGIYGTSKAAGEQAVREALDRHIVLRTSWVFGRYGANFVKTMRRLAAAGKPLRVVDDQRGCPTPAAALALALLTLADQLGQGRRTFGTYHFAGGEAISWHGLAEAVMAHAYPPDLRPMVMPITSSEFAATAPRPPNSVLDCSKIGHIFGISPADWRAGLGSVVAELDAEESV